MSKMVCDEKIVIEIIGDIISALRDDDVMSAYKYYNVLEGYIKRNRCGTKIIEDAIKLLKSADHGLGESMRLVLKEILEMVSKLKRAPKTKKKETKQKSRRKSKSKSRTRVRRKS